MLKVKYFAYGSNLQIERLKRRVEYFDDEIKPGTIYTLQNYKLSFNAGLEFAGYCFANIIPCIGEKVEGVLYDLSPEQFSRLDKYEALYEKQYFQINGKTIACTYVATKDNTLKKDKKPDLDYLNVIIDGAQNSNLIYTYNKLLEYKLKNYKIKKSKHAYLFKNSKR